MLGASNGLADPTDLVVKIKKKKKQPDGGNTTQQGERSCPPGGADRLTLAIVRF
jgi:hypothetical protein